MVVTSSCGGGSRYASVLVTEKEMKRKKLTNGPRDASTSLGPFFLIIQQNTTIIIDSSYVVVVIAVVVCCCRLSHRGRMLVQCGNGRCCC